MTGTTTVVNRLARQHFDFPLLIITYALAIFGVFAITVATYKYTGETLAVDTILARITSSYYGKRQGLFLLVSPIAILGMMAIPYQFFQRFSGVLYLGSLGFLAMVLAMGATTSGVTGWFSLFFRLHAAAERIREARLHPAHGQVLRPQGKPGGKHARFHHDDGAHGRAAAAHLRAGRAGHGHGLYRHLRRDDDHERHQPQAHRWHAARGRDGAGAGRHLLARHRLLPLRPAARLLQPRNGLVRLGLSGDQLQDGHRQRRPARRRAFRRTARTPRSITSRRTIRTSSSPPSARRWALSAVRS